MFGIKPLVLNYEINSIRNLKQFPGVEINWESTNNLIINADGLINRSEESDQEVKLTAILEGNIAGEKEYELVVRAEGTENVEVTNIDPYFAEDYPQAFIQDGNIWVKYKLVKKAELYMVVNQINGHHKSSVESVLQGHAGEGELIIPVEDWPYFKVDPLEEVVFDTGVKLLGGRSANIEFVIKGEEYVSKQVTRIEIGLDIVEAVHTAKPFVRGVFINQNSTEIYMYLNSRVDLSSDIILSEFSLNKGEITAISVHNYDEQEKYTPSYVVFSIGGITDKNDLNLSYMGESIYDESDAQNKLPKFENKQITVSSDEITEVVISSDRKSMSIKIENGWNMKESKPFNPTENIEIVIDEKKYMTSNEVGQHSVNHDIFKVEFTEALPESENITVTVQTNGMVNWAMDKYDESLSTTTVRQISEAGIPKATYAEGVIELTFAEGFEFDNSSYIGSGLWLKIDDVEYSLRGFIVHKNFLETNKLQIHLNDKYTQHLKELVAKGTDISLKYEKIYPTARGS